MKRDMDLVRKILFALEARNSPKAVFVLPIEGYDELTVKYHLLLLAQAGLLSFT